MRAKENQARFYVAGGTLRPDAPSYIKRAADDELLECVLKGEFCYVLNARQMGKSSLMVSTAGRLKQEDVRTVLIDLTAIGQNVSHEQWYYGVAAYLCEQLDLHAVFAEFWARHSAFTPHQRWVMTLTDLVLPAVEGRLAVFIDEIDLVRSLPFRTDEFFAGIRELYNRRSTNTDLNRVTFCLLGVATPAELINDPDLTPFNIGVRISLTDFTFEEARPLEAGLNYGRDSYSLLKRVLYWTGGHPYLTQRVCRAIASDQGVVDAGSVDSLCKKMFLTMEGRDRDDNLLFIRNRLLEGPLDRAKVLNVYLRILKRKPDVSSLHAPRIVAELLLSGVVKVANGRAVVRNRLYAKAFDSRWVLDNLPDAEQRRVKRAYWLGVVRTAGVFGVVLAGFAGLSVWALSEARAAMASEKRASSVSADFRHLYYVSQIHLAQDLLNQPGRNYEAMSILRDLREKQGYPAEFEWRYLWHKADPAIKTIKLDAPAGPPSASANGKFLVQAVGNRIQIRDSQGSLLREINVGKRTISASISDDGKIVSAGVKRRVLVFKDSDSTSTSFPLDFDWPKWIQVSPDGLYVVAATSVPTKISPEGYATNYDFVLHCFNVPSQHLLKIWPGGSGTVQGAWTSNDRYVYYADRKLFAIDPSSGSVSQVAATQKRISALAATSDAVFAADMNGLVTRYKWSNLGLVPAGAFSSRMGPIGSIIRQEIGSVAVVDRYSPILEVWKEGHLTTRLGPLDPGTSFVAAGDAHEMVWAHSDNTQSLVLYSTSVPSEEVVVRGSEEHPDQKVDTLTWRWHVMQDPSGRPWWWQPQGNVHAGGATTPGVHAVDFSMVGSATAVATDDAVTVSTWSGHTTTIPVHAVTLRISDDGLRALTVDRNRGAQLWDTTTGSMMWSVSNVDDAQISSNGKVVALSVGRTPTQVESLLAWTVEGWRNVEHFQIALSRAFALSPDGTFICYAIPAHEGSNLKMISTTSGSKIAEWFRPWGDEETGVLKVSPNSSRVFEGTLRGRIVVYDMTGADVLDLDRPFQASARHLASVTDISFAQNGATLAAYDDGSIIRWMAPSGSS